MSLTNEELAAIRERAEKATPGPWERSGRDDSTTWIEAPSGDILIHDERGHGHMRESFAWIERNNAEFIAHAREDVPALLDDNEQLRAEVERLRIDRDEWHADATVWRRRAVERKARLDKVREAGAGGRTELVNGLNVDDWAAIARAKDEAEADIVTRLDKVRALHNSDGFRYFGRLPGQSLPYPTGEPYCTHCQFAAPCPTIQALDGGDQ